ncbi:acetyl-CoA carboxylase biotin carboxyl carrier protein subunit [Martelella soudanensis]|uniref:acetyl-CoA carboxylase biotin carboxyl carrier protein subunit n=1 Tax=unclassified Martelella TaxID=2629616 RepID=UPI0015DF57A8|nr:MULTISPECIES: acetyl-CoA carboxylase biotin carboxyl carrier protein subunit [unclassified Martelella]
MAKTIDSIMAGNVWKILVKEGDSFDIGDTVAILESMKMEINIEADDAGTVDKLMVAEGDTVDEGTSLFSYS